MALTGTWGRNISRRLEGSVVGGTGSYVCQINGAGCKIFITGIGTFNPYFGTNCWGNYEEGNTFIGTVRDANETLIGYSGFPIVATYSVGTTDITYTATWYGVYGIATYSGTLIYAEISRIAYGDAPHPSAYRSINNTIIAPNDILNFNWTLVY